MIRQFISTLLLLALTTGCANTVTPKTVQSSQASWDGDAQNSGIIALTADHHGIVTPHFRDRYNVMVGTYGPRFQPPLKPDAGITATTTNTFLIDAEHMADFLRMNRWRKQGQ